MKGLKDHVFGIILVALGLCASGEAFAQDTGERHHLFRSQGIIVPAKQKQLSELLHGFDPEMVVSFDDHGQMLKVLSTVELDIGEVRNMCSLIGVELQPVQRLDGIRVNE